MTDVYVSMAQMGDCKACGQYKDLRFGCCFDCSDFVVAKRISPVTYRVWDSRKPDNQWFVSEDHN